MKFQFYSFSIVLICITLMPSQVFGNVSVDFDWQSEAPTSSHTVRLPTKNAIQQRLLNEYIKKMAATKNYNF